MLILNELVCAQLAVPLTTATIAAITISLFIVFSSMRFALCVPVNFLMCAIYTTRGHRHSILLTAVADEDDFQISNGGRWTRKWPPQARCSLAPGYYCIK